MLLLAYIAMSGAMGGTSATARAAPIAHTLDQLTSGSARYELALSLRLARGLIQLALSYALTTSLVAVAAAVATGGEPVEPEQHAAADGQPEQRAHGNLDGLDGNAYATAAAGPSGRADESLQGSANEPEQRAHGNLDGLDGNAYTTAAETGVGQGESLPHGSANEPEQRAHAEPNGLEGNASVTAGTEAGIASGFSDTPPETSTEALPTMRRELDVYLPSGDTPTKLTSALKPLAPIGPRTATVLSHRLNTQVELTHVPASGKCALSIASSTEEEAAAGEEPVLRERGSPAATLDEPEPDMLRAWLGNLCEINTEADLEPEEPEQRALGEPDGLRAWLGNLCEINTEADLEPDKPEQCAHAEPNGLEGNASATAGTEAGIASGFSDAPPEMSFEALPTTRYEIPASSREGRGLRNLL